MGQNFFSKDELCLEEATCPGQLRCLGQNFFLIKRTFRISGTPVRRPRRQKSKKMHFQKFWDSCAQNKTPEISNNALSRILGLLCEEQNVRNLNKCTFKNYGTPVRKTKRRHPTGVLCANAVSGSCEIRECWASTPRCWASTPRESFARTMCLRKL